MAIEIVRESHHMAPQKALWPKTGPWTTEPDKVQARHTPTDFPVLVVRHPYSGHLCGYVGVPAWHPAFEQHYDAAEKLGPADEDGWRSLGVHGGLTFSDRCQEGAGETGICHVPEPGHADRVWWLGFDMAHSGDMSPMYDWNMVAKLSPFGYEYRTVEYVLKECEQLAAQLAAVPLTVRQRREQAREYGRILAHSTNA